MKKVNGKIILVDDEAYERQFLVSALRKRNWEVNVEYFMDPEDALEHLRKNSDEIFLIISDLHMPKMNGLEFKKAIDQDEILSKKSIPFIYVSAGSSTSEITEAYDYGVRGCFAKPNNLEEQADIFDTIIKYWIISRHPHRDHI